MHILFYEQAVCKRGTKIEKSYLKMMESHIGIAKAKNKIFTVQRTELKDVEDFFSESQPNRHAHSPRKICIVSL